MNFLKVTAYDIKRILKSRFIAISIIAIIITPVFYSLFYLSSFWDPYGNIQNLPVAVVNLDKGSTNDNKSVNYGKDLIDELKDNKDVGWRFVSKEDADSGLTGKKYYGEVIIPEDFSEKSLSAKNGTPEKPNIIFKDNPKKNYIAVKIASSIKTNLDEKITQSLVKEYTKVTFDNLYDLKDGMFQASDGSSKITDTIASLKDGSTKLTNAIPALENGNNQLTTGLSSAKDGSNQLKTGLEKLSNNIPGLQTGISNLFNGSSALSDGLANAKSGTYQLENGLSASKSGSSHLKDGLNSLNNKIPELQKATKDLSDGSQNELDAITKIAGAVFKTNNAVNIGDKNTPSLVSALDKVNSGSKTLGENLKNLNSSVSDGNSSLSASVDKLNKGTYGLEQLLEQYNSSNTTAHQKEYLMQQILDISKNLNAGTKALNASVNEDTSSKPSLKSSIAKLSSAFNGDSTTPGLVGSIGSIYTNVSTGQNSLSYALSSINSALNGTNGINLLIGMQNIAQGTNDLNQQVPQLHAATNALYNGASDLNDGTNKLYAGAVNLSSGTTDLYNGAVTMNTGLSTLSSSTPAIANGIKQLYDGASSLNDGTNKLYTGMINLNDGSTQVYNGIKSLNDGNNKVYDGSKELTNKLSDGSNKLNNDLKNSSSTMSDFVAQPLNVQTEHLFADETYGTALAPYFIPISIWIGALLMFFVVPDTVEKSIKVGGKSIVLGKYIVYILLGTLQAICISTVVMIIGVSPSNIAAFYLFNIFTSWVFVALMQCLIFLLKDVGRLLGIILLVLQLASSAGTFPIELSPAFYRTVSPYVPFTYVVSALREIINGINYSILKTDILFLIGVFVVFFSLSLIFKDKVGKLHEAMETSENAA